MLCFEMVMAVLTFKVQGRVSMPRESNVCVSGRLTFAEGKTWSGRDDEELWKGYAKVLVAEVAREKHQRSVAARDCCCLVIIRYMLLTCVAHGIK